MWCHRLGESPWRRWFHFTFSDSDKAEQRCDAADLANMRRRRISRWRWSAQPPPHLPSLCLLLSAALQSDTGDEHIVTLLPKLLPGGGDQCVWWSAPTPPSLLFFEILLLYLHVGVVHSAFSQTLKEHSRDNWEEGKWHHFYLFISFYFSFMDDPIKRLQNIG